MVWSMPTLTVSPPYAALNAHLNATCSSDVSLTFEEIEAILGFALPPVARLHKEWWTDGDSAADAPQLRAWSLAGRRAYANLSARSVSFERSPTSQRAR